MPGTSNGYAGSFTVQNQPTAAFNGNVLAFPDTNIGCEGGFSELAKRPARPGL